MRPTAHLIRFARWVMVLALLAGLGTGSAPARESAGRTVVERGTLAEDLFAAGGTVDVQADVEGDAIAAGGTVTLAGAVSGDAIVAGGSVTVPAAVGDNLLVAGGWVRISGPVAGKVLAAGGRVELGAAARVAERLAVAGGSVQIGGVAEEQVSVVAGSVLVLGIIQGDLEVAAGELEIAETARIAGRVIYRGPEAPEVAPGAEVVGGVRFLATPGRDVREVGWIAGILGPLVFIGLGLFVLGAVFFWAFPGFTEAAGRSLRARPLASLGLGFAVVVAGPFAIVLLMVTVLGIPLALALLGLYLLALLLGLVVAGFGLSGWAVRRWGPLALYGRWRRLAWFLGATVLFALIALVPVVGALVLFVLLVLGVGAAVWQLFTQEAPAHP